MQVCDFCFSVASPLAAPLSLGPASRCFLLLSASLAGIQLNLSYNSVRIQPGPCLAVSQPWKPFMGCFALAVLQPQPGAPLCPQVVPASFNLPVFYSLNLFPWDLPSSCMLELNWGNSEDGDLASHLPPSLPDSEPLLPLHLWDSPSVRFWEDKEILDFP